MTFLWILLGIIYLDFRDLRRPGELIVTGVV